MNRQEQHNLRARMVGETQEFLTGFLSGCRPGQPHSEGCRRLNAAIEQFVAQLAERNRQALFQARLKRRGRSAPQ